MNTEIKKVEPAGEVMELSVDEQSHVAGGAIDSFLKLGTIKGESVTKGFEDDIL